MNPYLVLTNGNILQNCGTMSSQDTDGNNSQGTEHLHQYKLHKLKPLICFLCT